MSIDSPKRQQREGHAGGDVAPDKPASSGVALRRDTKPAEQAQAKPPTIGSGRGQTACRAP